MPLSLNQLRERATRHEGRKRWSREYPPHPMVDFDFKLKRSVRSALSAFKGRHPFRLEGTSFLASTRMLYADLALAYDMPRPSVTHAGPWEGDSGESSYSVGHPSSRSHHNIILRGKRSVLTALHEFAHARGYGETGAVWWSVNAFRLTWPKSFAKLRPANGSHFLVAGEARTVEEAEVQWRAFYLELAASEAALAVEQEAARSREQAAARQLQDAQRRSRQARDSARTQERELADQARANTGALRFPPTNSSDWETTNWARLGAAARQTIFLRRQAEAGNAPQTSAAPITQAPTEDPSIVRFRNLDLSDTETPATAADDVGDERFARFRLLQLDDPQTPLAVEPEPAPEPVAAETMAERIERYDAMTDEASIRALLSDSGQLTKGEADALCRALCSSLGIGPGELLPTRITDLPAAPTAFDQLMRDVGLGGTVGSRRALREHRAHREGRPPRRRRRRGEREPERPDPE